MASGALPSRRRFLQLAGVLGGGAVATGLYTWRIEPHLVELVHRDLPIVGLPEPLVGKILVQLSDIHAGREVADSFLRDSFALVNQLEPAFVVLTGDFMTAYRGEELDRTFRLMEHLRPGRLGTVAITGNHDFGMTACFTEVADRLCAGLRNQGIVTLRNEQHTLAGLTFVGVEDLWGPFFALRQALSGLAPETPRLMLCHNPDAADVPGWGDYQGWILCGHTHGGQCKPPFLPPPCLPVENRRYVAGEVDLGDGRRLYINRALGHLLRVRFNVRPEITIFRLCRPA